MTVPAQDRFTFSSGNGVTTTFPYTFMIPGTVDDPQFLVYLIEIATGVRTNLTVGVDYSISGLGVEAGGVVTYPLSGTPLPATHRLVIESNMPYEQQTDVYNSGTLYLAAIEDQFDNTTRQVQQIQDRVNRTLSVGIGYGGNYELFPVADMLIGWNSGGTGLENKQSESESAAAAYAAQLAAEAAQVAAEGALAAIPAEVAKRVIEFDARMSQFGGGVLWNDIDDDTPAVQAALDYFQTLGGLTQYEGKNSALLRLPRGVGRISGLDMSAASNVIIAGQGDAVTTLRNTIDQTCLKTTNVSGVNDLFRLQLKDFTIMGPGRANAQAHGIDFFAVNNGLIENVRIYACRAGMRFTNNWQTNVIRPMMDGGPAVGGSLTCYDGIYMMDGPGDVVENAVKFTGGIVSGAERFGFRGESVSGSLVIGLEMLACGDTAMFIGDNPSGKDLKWFSVVGCLFDSSGDLLIVSKGASTVAKQIHVSSCWFGNGTAGSGQADAMRVIGIKDSSFQADIISNVDNAFVGLNCDGVNFEFGNINDYDKSLVGAVPIVLESCQNMKVFGGPMRKTATSPSTACLAETGTTDYSNIQGFNGDGGMTIIGANSIVKGNNGFKTRNSGSADVVIGTSSTVVSHGLGRTPVNGDIIAVPRYDPNLGGVSRWWIDTLTATQFTLHVDTNVVGNNIAFSWQADVSRG